MLGKNSCLLVSLFLGVIGCAEPKYERVEQVAGLPSQHQKVTDCEIELQKSGYCLIWQWEQRPTASQIGTLIFKVVRPNLLDGSAMPVDIGSGSGSNLTPALVLWMPSMGHGSTPTRVEQVDRGSFRATSVFFIMPGEWEMKFQFKDGNTVKDEAVVALAF